MRGLGASVLAMSIFALGGGVARAQQAASSDAERLFREAMAAQQRGHYAEACSKLAESDRIERAPGTEYNLGLCYELTHRPASARRAYLQAAELAGSSATNKPKVANDARARAVKLERRVPRIVLRLAESATTAVITVDDVVIESQHHTDVEVDPGTHRIRATAEGRVPFESVVDLVEGQRAELMIALDATDGFVRSVPALTSTKDMNNAEPDASGSGAASNSTSSSATLPTLAYVGLVIGAIGVTSLGTAAYFTVSARDGRDDSRCIDGRFCPDDSAASRLREAKSDADMATLFAVSGAILVVAGAAMFFFTPRHRVTAGIRGAGFAGTF